MKKTFTIIIFFSFVFVVRAQDIPEGTAMIGGSLSYSHDKQKAENNEVLSNSLVLNPSIGKFYHSNRLLGINLTYNRSTSSNYDGAVNGYGAGVFLRQYLPLAKSFYVFAQEGVSFWYSHFKKENTQLAYRSDSKMINAGLYFFPGIAYGITRRLQLELALTPVASINYSHTNGTVSNSGTPDARTKQNSFYVRAGSPDADLGSMSFGAKWLLAKR